MAAGAHARRGARAAGSGTAPRSTAPLTGAAPWSTAPAARWCRLGGGWCGVRLEDVQEGPVEGSEGAEEAVSAFVEEVEEGGRWVHLDPCARHVDT